jgi:hypothetical protein
LESVSTPRCLLSMPRLIPRSSRADFISRGSAVDHESVEYITALNDDRATQPSHRRRWSPNGQRDQRDRGVVHALLHWCRQRSYLVLRRGPLHAIQIRTAAHIKGSRASGTAGGAACRSGSRRRSPWSGDHRLVEQGGTILDDRRRSGQRRVRGRPDRRLRAAWRARGRTRWASRPPSCPSP